VIGQRAADQYRAQQRIGGGGFDAHDHAAVVEQQFVTDATVLDQVRIVDPDDFLGAFGQRVGGGEGEAIAHLEFDFLVGELGDTDFRALQVTQQRHVATVASGDLADQAGTGLVFVRSAMAEVQAGHVEAGEDQLFDHFRRIAGGAQGGYDFCTANSHALTPLLTRSQRLLL
jgi:hypothetical protein